MQNLIGALIPLAFFSMLIYENLRPKVRKYPRVPRWILLGAVFYTLSTSVLILVSYFIPQEWLIEHRLLDGARLGVLGGTIAGFVGITFIEFWIHRLSHKYDLLWRALHQMHHSPIRIDMFGWLIAHPLELAVLQLLRACVLLLGFGIDPVAGMIVGVITAVIQMSGHWNIRTPRWLGYIVPRPEMHCIHHKRGFHGKNYSDFVLWDMLFGTYENPVGSVEFPVGFEESASSDLIGMLAFKDVNAPIYGAESQGQLLSDQ